MVDEIGTQSVEQDSSMAGAVAAMPDIDMLEKGAPVDRGDNGQFKSREPVEDKADAPPKDEQPEQPDKADAKADDEPAKADDDTEDGDDGDYIEVAGEDGAEPKRIPIAEALERYSKFEELQAQLAEQQQTQVPPEQYDTAISMALEQASQYENGLRQLQQWLQPQMPSAELVNPNSPHYDPEAYHQQLEQARQLTQMRQQVDAEAQRVRGDRDSRQQAVLETRQAREWAAALQAWPELKETSTRERVVSDVSEAYGFPADEVRAIGDHRVLKVLKDALAYRQQRAAKDSAVKVVSAKPKLVRSKARQSQSGKAARFAEANDRLTQSNSLDDAAEAIGGLLG